MGRKFRPLLLAALMALLLAGCGAPQSGQGSPDGNNAVNSPPVSQAPGTTSPQTGTQDPSAPASPGPETPEQRLKNAAVEIVEILRDRDLERLSGIIDSDKGLLFSPYAHINAQTALTFQAHELPDFKDGQKRVWGSYDGSGEPIELTFLEYFEKFVYNRDFASAPEVSLNSMKGTGNSSFNGLEVFPGASYVEFHYPGFDKQYEGMDWESLILVLLPDGQDWKLCAIVHAGWTI